MRWTPPACFRADLDVSEGSLQVRDIVKSFGASRALNGVTFELTPGEVHAIVGENGAGKSTLMKVVSGAIRADGGSMTLSGISYDPRSAREAKQRGVAMIYQELALAPHLSVEANVMLGQEYTRLGVVRRHTHRELVCAALSLLDHSELKLNAPVHTLGVAARQLVEIARALVSDARVIIFDEPTSSLTEHDSARLFGVIRKLRAKGLSIVYISHFLEEVRAIADRYTVLRDGRTVATGSIADTDQRTLIRHMVGRVLEEIYPKIPHAPGETILEVSALQTRHSFSMRADLSVRRGEILGIAGLIGAGRTELIRAIFGLDRVISGRVIVKGDENTSATPRQRIRQGLGFLSEDRKEEGLALSRSIEDNLTYPALGRHARWGWLNLRERRRDVGHFLKQVNVRCQGPGQSVGNLSGGNQQKIAMARLLHQGADVLLLDDPTRGIDVGSKAEIYRIIGELAAKGVAVVMVSSSLPELFGVCDRLAVMCRGTLSAAKPITEWNQHSVMDSATAG